MSRRAWTAAAALVCFSMHAYAEPALTPAGYASPVAAWTEFCQRETGECAVDISQPARIDFTLGIRSLVASVNIQVNHAIVGITDAERWGTTDFWNFPKDGSGDCEDYQLLKRSLLVQAGIPRRVLRMTVVLDHRGEGHAVLMIRTTEGDFILDNLNDSVLRWDQTEYIFIKRESQTHAGWVVLRAERDNTVVAGVR